MIKIQVKNLPTKPGIYIFKDKKGNILYVGKAKNIKKRIIQHFQKQLVPDKQFMIKKIDKIDYVLTKNELEAILLETEYIKKYKPKFNIQFKDDKSFIFIKITKEKFPKVILTRKIRDKKAEYFGPYPIAKGIKEFYKSLRKIFPFRSCNKLPKALCLHYYLGNCLGVCIYKNKEKKYKEMISNLKKFLEKEPEILKIELEKELSKAVKKQLFEYAAILRDKIFFIENLINLKEIKLENYKYLIKNDKKALEELKSVLNLSKLNRIEAYDISNLFGEKAVGSMVVYQSGEFNKKDYRRFFIQEKGIANDTDMLRKLLERRIKHKTWEKPDLILVDGGKPQLNSALKVINNKFKNVKVIALAKKQELIYLPKKHKPIKLPLTSPALNLLRKIRDEAHRFAISYHRKKKISF